MTNQLLSVVVPGVAAPQGSKRRGRNGQMFEANKRLGPWREAVTTICRQHYHEPEPYDGPAEVVLTIRLPRPKRPKFRAYPAVPPDTDKLQRAIGDALTNAGVLKDDARIVHWDTWKIFTPDGASPAALITVNAL